MTAGSLDAVKLTEYTTGTIIYRRVTVPAYASSANVVKLWDYTQGDWSTMIVQVVDGAGTFWSPGRLTRSPGRAADERRGGVSASTCPATSRSFSARRRFGVTRHSQPRRGGGGVPTILTDASTAAGKWASMYVRNSSTTTATEIDVDLGVR